MGASVKQSKALAYLLRHNPAAAELELDEAGWIDVTELVDRMNEHGFPITRAQLESVVFDSAKRRYELVDGRIRAAQGHSIAIDLGLEPSEPPSMLFHGTVERFLEPIWTEGLRAGSRTHVHLSADLETAEIVGGRRGVPIVLTIDAAGMRRDGHTFFVADNGVWLTDDVPVEFLGVHDGEAA